MNKLLARLGCLLFAVCLAVVPRSASRADDLRFWKLAGDWTVTYGNGAVRAYSLDTDGKLQGTAGQAKLTGQLELRDSRLLLTFNDDKLERLSLKDDGRLSVEQWNAKAGYPKQRPAQTGTGIRQNRPPNWVAIGDFPIHDLVGQWTVVYGNTAVHLYKFDKDGKMGGRTRDAKGNDVALTGQILQKDGRVLLNHYGEQAGQVPPLERLTLRIDGRLIVEHWNPRSGFDAGNKPDTVGLGVPVTGNPNSAVELLDAFMLRKMEAIGCSAASLTIARGKRILISRGYGWLDADHRNAAMQPDTPMGIASCDKAFERSAIQQLAREGKLDLNASVFKVLGVKPAGEIVDPRIWDITPNILMVHKAGWQGDPLAKAEQAYEAAGGKPAPPLPLADWLDKELPYVMTQRLAWTPGTKDEYDNFGYHVLKLLIIRLSGQTLPEYYRSQLCRPYGIKELKWIREAGPPRPGEPRRLWNGLHGASNDPASVGFSTPAMCTLMGCYSYEGLPGGNNQQDNVAQTGSYINATSVMHWRSDGLNIAFDFNGSSDQDHVELNDLEVVVSQLVAEGKLPAK